MHIVYDTLRSLEITDKKIITLFNKMDQPMADEQIRDFRADYVKRISAKRESDLDEVKELLAKVLRENKIYVEHVFSYEQAGMIQQVRKQGELLLEEYTPEGIFIKAYVPSELYEKIK